MRAEPSRRAVRAGRRPTANGRSRRSGARLVTFLGRRIDALPWDELDGDRRGLLHGRRRRGACRQARRARVLGRHEPGHGPAASPRLDVAARRGRRAAVRTRPKGSIPLRSCTGRDWSFEPTERRAVASRGATDAAGRTNPWVPRVPSSMRTGPATRSRPDSPSGSPRGRTSTRHFGSPPGAAPGASPDEDPTATSCVPQTWTRRVRAADLPVPHRRVRMGEWRSRCFGWQGVGHGRCRHLVLERRVVRVRRPRDRTAGEALHAGEAAHEHLRY